MPKCLGRNRGWSNLSPDPYKCVIKSLKQALPQSDKNKFIKVINKGPESVTEVCLKVIRMFKI